MCVWEGDTESTRCPYRHMIANFTHSSYKTRSPKIYRSLLDQSDYQINQITRSIRLLVQSCYQINQITSSIRLLDQSDQRGRKRDGREVNDLVLVLISRIFRFLTPSAQFIQTDGETEEKETDKQIKPARLCLVLVPCFLHSRW